MDLKIINDLLDNIALAQFDLNGEDLLGVSTFLRDFEKVSFFLKDFADEGLNLLIEKIVEGLKILIVKDFAPKSELFNLIGLAILEIQNFLIAYNINEKYLIDFLKWQADFEFLFLDTKIYSDDSFLETKGNKEELENKFLEISEIPTKFENNLDININKTLNSDLPPLLTNSLFKVIEKIKLILVSMEEDSDPLALLSELKYQSKLLLTAVSFMEFKIIYKVVLDILDLIASVQVEAVVYNTAVADLFIEGSAIISKGLESLVLINKEIKEKDSFWPLKELEYFHELVFKTKQGLSTPFKDRITEQTIFADKIFPKRLGDILVAQGSVSVNEIEQVMKTQKEKRSQKLGGLLVETKIISKDDLLQALETQKENPGQKIGQTLINLGFIDSDNLDKFIKTQEEIRATRLGEFLVKSNVGNTADVAEALRQQKKNEGQPLTTPMAKVETSKLDDLINLVGELVIAQSLIDLDDIHLKSRQNKIGKNLTQVNRITSELQRNAMGLRMVPVRFTFQKMNRLVRDLARRFDKKVDLNLIGGETEIDRNMIEAVYDPLVHMVRNSLDHGLEEPEARKAKGKPSGGNLTIKAYHQGGNVVIELIDDGRGLDKDSILQKAIQQNLIGEQEKLTEQEIFNLLFLPGFSTNQNVTDVSGRGIGMSVVKRAIERLRGKVEISSKLNYGTKIIIRLPLTLAIIDGMIVRVGEHRYILPTVSISESFRPLAENFFTVKKEGELIKVREELLPLIRLGNIVGDSTAGHKIDETLVVVVENDGKKCCLLVDEVLGKQEVVIKSLGERLSYVKILAGASILGDGRVGLILDVPGLFALSNNQ